MMAFVRQRANWQAWWPARAAEVAEATYTRLQAAIDAWQLRDVSPVPGGEVALVCSATFGEEPVILKVSPDVGEATLAAEPRALRAWQSSGVVPRVLASRDGDLSFLLEKLEPGNPLLESEPDVLRRIAILGDLAGRLHRASVEVDGIPKLRESDFVMSQLHHLRTHRDEAVLRTLASEASRTAVLHTDLHAYNALNHSGTWKVIDPKPCVGDPHADIFVLIREEYPPGRRARDVAELLMDCYANAAGLEVDRTREWVRVCARAQLANFRSWSVPLSPDRAAWRDSLENLVHALDVEG